MTEKETAVKVKPHAYEDNSESTAIIYKDNFGTSCPFYVFKDNRQTD